MTNNLFSFRFSGTTSMLTIQLFVTTVLYIMYRPVRLLLLNELK